MSGKLGDKQMLGVVGCARRARKAISSTWYPLATGRHRLPAKWRMLISDSKSLAAGRNDSLNSCIIVCFAALMRFLGAGRSSVTCWPVNRRWPIRRVRISVVCGMLSKWHYKNEIACHLNTLLISRRNEITLLERGLGRR